MGAPRVTCDPPFSLAFLPRALESPSPMNAGGFLEIYLGLKPLRKPLINLAP
jgi:hypothetical protein